jgi:hypothetical protein
MSGLDHLGTLGMDGLRVIWKRIFKKCGVREKAHFWWLGRAEWWELVNVVMNLLLPCKAVSVLTG